MKKTMFITSVIMVIVLAVALTTSSLAWFSASGQATVYTDTLKLTAKATASDGIAISHDGLNWETDSSVELRSGADISTNLLPVVPFNKGTTPTADRLLAALVGGQEAPYISLSDFAEDYPKYVASQACKYASVYAAAAADSTSDWGDAESGSYGGEIIDVDEYEEDEETEELVLLEGKDGYVDAFVAFYGMMCANGYISSQDILGATEVELYNNRDAFMIGNKLDFNSLFTDNLYRDGYYTDTMYIKNLATGTGAQSVNLNTLVSFYFSNPVTTDEVDPDTGMPIIRYETYNYQRTYRGEKYDLDPTLCVAVIAKKDATNNGLFLTDSEYFQSLALQEELEGLQADFEAALTENNYTRATWAAFLATNTPIDEFTEEQSAVMDAQVAVEEKQAQIDALTAYDWEIIAYAESKGAPAGNYIPSTLNMGLTAENFAEGAVSKLSTGTLSTEGLNKTNSVALRGDHTYYDEAADQNIDVPADILEIKVIAWYDGTTLHNNNSNDGSATSDYMRGSANIEFKLSFITAE